MRIEEISQRLDMTEFNVEILCAIANIPLREDEEGKYIDDCKFNDILVLLPDEYGYYQSSMPSKKVVQMNRYRERKD